MTQEAHLQTSFSAVASFLSTDPLPHRKGPREPPMAGMPICRLRSSSQPQAVLQHLHFPAGEREFPASTASDQPRAGLGTSTAMGSTPLREAMTAILDKRLRRKPSPESQDCSDSWEETDGEREKTTQPTLSTQVGTAITDRRTPSEEVPARKRLPDSFQTPLAPRLFGNPKAERRARSSSSRARIYVVRPRAHGHGPEATRADAVNPNPNPIPEKLITTDEQFFREVRRTYDREFCTAWRRLFSFKSLRVLRFRRYVQDGGEHPEVVQMEPEQMHTMLHLVRRPDEVSTLFQTPGVWINFVFPLRKEGQDGVVTRHMLEFVEGWNVARIVIGSSVPIVLSVVLGVAWTLLTTDPQTAFTVAGFVLTLGAALVALLAVVADVSSSN
ncbi:hypothetical protein VTK73DRAFT_1178 [Phialemonium thermophilum]|uniref:Transmembrane protein n=1 Tax=Phialemonium thermophilum TaxID=223376 RepID=A0ABR3VTT3_9PEZI